MGVANVHRVIERWTRDQVLALAPDAPSQKAAQKVASPGTWSARGTTGTVVFGVCRGSGSTPYQACVDLTEPAYRCSCPSRKFPCKHALALLLLWSAGGVPEADTAPDWVAEWLAGRAARAAKAEAKLDAARAAADPGAGGADGAGGSNGGPGGPVGSESARGTGAGSDGAAGADGDVGLGSGAGSGAGLGGSGGAGAGLGPGVGGAAVRHARVAAGLAELERWLGDQARQGMTGAAERDWEELAKRLIDAQCPGVAGTVSRLARVRGEDGWPERLLAEYALLNLLAVAYRRRAELPADLAQTVLMRVGFPVAREDVLAGPPIRDLWDVLGRRDEQQDRLTSRRVWLRGRATGRAALILSFAAPGQALDLTLIPGTTIDADLTFYPGAAPLRALIATRHPAPTPTPTTPGLASTPSAPVTARGPAVGVSVEEALEEVARAVAADPWTDSWPVVLAEVVPGATTLGGLALHAAARDPWRLIAVSGGRPVTVAAEWTPQGLRPLSVWDDEGQVVIL